VIPVQWMTDSNARLIAVVILFMGAKIALSAPRAPSEPAGTISPPPTAGDFQPLSAEEKSKLIQDFPAIWAGYHSEIATAEIDYLFITFLLKTRQLSCDEFLSELRKIPLVPDKNLTRRLVQQFCPELLQGPDTDEEAVLRAVGDWRTYRQQGTERRCLSKTFEHVVADDLHLLVDHPNRGVRAYRRGDCNFFYETMDWFRTMPNEALLKEATVFQNPEELYRLEYYGPAREKAPQTHASWMTLGQTDGLPRQWQMLAATTGELLRMEQFLDYTLYPGDVLCPTVRIKINVDKGKVSNVRLTIIQRAEFNMPFPENAFVLSTPADWSWFDWQHERHDGGQWKQPVSDVARFFRGRTAGTAREPAAASKSSGTSWRSLMLIFNGLILIVIGVALWRRSS